MATVDWSDPCARAAALTVAYYEIVQGGQETLIRSRGPEGEREVRYGKADLSWLLREMQAAQSECALKQGLPDPNRRFSIRAGAQRRGPGCY